MTYWETYFGDAETAWKTIDKRLGLCIMDIMGYECTSDSAVTYRCPLYNRCTYEEIIRFLESEVPR